MYFFNVALVFVCGNNIWHYIHTRTYHLHYIIILNCHSLIANQQPLFFNDMKKVVFDTTIQISLSLTTDITPKTLLFCTS